MDKQWREFYKALETCESFYEVDKPYYNEFHVFKNNKCTVYTVHNGKIINVEKESKEQWRVKHEF